MDVESASVPSAKFCSVEELQTGLLSLPPIFCIHSGSGETQVFNNLSEYFSDHHVYAIRAPGFRPGEQMFKSLGDMIEQYTNAIRARQMNGPYILLGYSFGGMIAFEVGKRLESLGERVGFLGILDHPPHIKYRMATLDWSQVALGLMRMKNLIGIEEAQALYPFISQFPKDQALDEVFKSISIRKLREVHLSKDQLKVLVDLSWELLSLARHYEPSGSVADMDVFYAMPVTGAQNKQKWLEDHLLSWSNFIRTNVKFHDVAGTHDTLIGPENVESFQIALKEAMRLRGVI